MSRFFKQWQIVFCCTVALFIGGFFPLVAQAQSGESLTLTVDEAVNYALKNSKTLQSATIDLQMKERAKRMVWNGFLPSVQASATMNRNTELSDPSAFMSSLPFSANLPPWNPVESDHWNFVGNLSASLNLSLALIDGIRIPKAQYEAGLITWEQTQKETELNIRKMFYAILLQQESLALQKVSLANAEERVAQAEINYRNGYIPELSLLQAQVSYENQKPGILKAEQGLVQQLDMFGFLLGLPLETNIVLEGEIKPEFIELDTNSLVEQYLDTRLDVQFFNKNKHVLELQLAALNFQSFTPALAFNYNWQPIVGNIKEGWFDDANTMDRGTFSIRLAWSLSNMLPFSANRQNAKTIEDNILKMELQYESLIQNAEMEVHNLIDALRYSKTVVEAAQRNIALAQKSYDMTVTAYESGAAELLDVRDAETQLNQAKLGEMSERYNYLSALLDLEYSLNTKLGKE